MRTIAWVTAALAVALTAACKDRDRRDDGTNAAVEQTTGEVREGAAKTEDAAADAGDKVGDAANDAADKTEDAAKDAADKADDATDDAAGTVEKTADNLGLSSYSYERRDAFRKDVDHQLAAMDKELAGLRQGVNKDASETYTSAVAAAEKTRKAVGTDIDRLAGATAATWDDIQGDVRASLDSLNRQLQALRPDAKPMGGAGPS